jgi:hypothetical protein
MYCSQEQHEKLVAEFDAYKKKSKKWLPEHCW